LLSYWCQTYTDGVNATFWVKVSENLSESDAEIFVYYGNEDAASLSNQVDTFVDVIGDVVLALPMDEGQGTTTFDYSGNGFNGAIEGASWTEGEYNKALSFDGVDDYVNTSSISLNLLTSSFTFTAWMKPSYSLPDPPYASLPIVANFPHIGISIAAIELDEFDVKGWMDGYSSNYNSKQTWGSWHHVVVVYKGLSSSERELYVDGVLVGTDTVGTAGNFTGLVRIGNPKYVAQPSSVIDEVQIYNQTLTSTQISNSYNNYGDPTIEAGKVLVRKRVDPEPMQGATGLQQDQENSRPNPIILALPLLFSVILVVYLFMIKRRHSQSLANQDFARQ